MNADAFQPENSPALSRRSFLKSSSLAAAGVAATNLPFVLTTHAAPDDPIRIGVIGCGGRGGGAALDALGATTEVVYPKAGYHTETVKSDTKRAILKLEADTRVHAVAIALRQAIIE